MRGARKRWKDANFNALRNQSLTGVCGIWLQGVYQIYPEVDDDDGGGGNNDGVVMMNVVIVMMVTMVVVVVVWLS